MPEVRLQDGSVITFPEGMSEADINAALSTFRPNTPPPGVIIHEANRSYVAGSPDAPSVSTAGMDDDARNRAAAALYLRQNAPGVPQELMPAVQGATMSFGDELRSLGFGAGQALKGGSFTEGYNLSQEAQRQGLEQERAQHPIRSTALQIGGALATAPALSGALGAGQGLSLASRTALGAGTGLAYGGVEGFGSGSGALDRAKKAYEGATTGAAIGAAVPWAEEGTRRLANRIIDRFTAANLGKLGVDKPAANAVTRALAADQAFGGVGAANIATAGPEGMLADAGPSARAALDVAAQRSGPAALTARQATDMRGIQANRTLRAALDRTLGKPEGVATSTANIRTGTAAARGTAYDAAYAAPIDYSAPAARDLETALTRVPASAINKANDLMKLEGARSAQVMASIAPDGTVIYQTLPDVRQLDYITRGLRHLAESGEDAGKLGGRTDFSRGYINLSQDIRGIMRDLVPQYGKALDTAADPITRIQATRLGADMLSAKMPRDEVAMAVSRMSKPELDAVKQGIRSQIDEAMANVKGAASDPNQDARAVIAALRQLNTPAVRQKLTTVLSQAQAGYLTREIERASKAAELYSGMVRNSATFGRGAVDEANKQIAEPGMIGSLKEGAPMQAGKRAVQFAFGTTPQDKLATADAMNQQIAELLTGRQGPNAISTLQALENAYRAGPANSALARLIGENLGVGTGLSLYQGAARRPEAR